MTSRFLPYARQLVEEDDIEAVIDVLRGDWLTTGPAIEAFESALCDEVGAKQAVVCSSGTAALHLAAMALEPKDDAAVIVPSITFVATANAARYVGAEVIFCDVDPDTGLMGPVQLDEAIRRSGRLRPAAVFPVHMAGQICDMPAIRDVAQQHQLAVVEDACHALGTRQEVGRDAIASAGDCVFSDMAVFSFHAVKTVSMGEGGAITTNSAAVAERVRRLRNHGLVRNVDRFEQRDMAHSPEGEINPWYYEMPAPGFNYRIGDAQCALGLSQLRKLHRFIRQRRDLVERYDAALRPFAPAIKSLRRQPGCMPCWHLYVVLIDFDALGVSRATLMKHLHEYGIGTQVHYIPVHWQPYYRKRYGTVSLPGAEEYYRRALSLPLFAGMTEADVDRVCGVLIGALGGDLGLSVG